MIANAIAFFTKRWGWEQVAVIAAIAMVLLAALTGVYWLLWGGIFGIAPKALRKIQESDKQRDDEQIAIERKHEVYSDEMKERHRRFLDAFDEMNRAKEREIEESSQKKSAEEMRRRVLNGIDDVGRD